MPLNVLKKWSVTLWFYFNGKNVKVTVMVKVTVKSKGNSKGKGKVTVNTFIISLQPVCSVKFYKPNQLQWGDERTAKFLASVWMIAICDLRFAYLKLLKPKLKFRSTVWPPLLDLDPNPFLIRIRIWLQEIRINTGTDHDSDQGCKYIRIRMDPDLKHC